MDLTAGNVFLWARLAAAQPGAISPFLSEFVTKKAPAAPSTSTRPAKGQRQAAGVAREGILAAIKAAVETVVGGVVAEDQPLMEAGLDSLGAFFLYAWQLL